MCDLCRDKALRTSDRADRLVEGRGRGIECRHVYTHAYRHTA